MPTPVLTTKLFIPPPRPNAVLRPGLLARLNAGLHRRLTLISAPAGFGKTSLLSAWAAERMKDEGGGMRDEETPHPSPFTLHPSKVAWLSLDEGDSDPARFLAYLVAALQTLEPTIGAEVAGALKSPQPPPIEALLPLLLNAIADLPQPAILVLDDYHLLDARPIDQALVFLVEHMPPQLHLVIATREDPPLPLARLRARNQLTELRAADLRFTAAEAAAFLNQMMGLSLSAQDIATLEARTEGWIAGLQLAALSLQGHQDAPAFIQAFAGDHRYVLDYLVEEVLQRLPEPTRSFLLQTAILDRLSGPLCDAVTGQDASGARLEALHRGNFFVVPLDDRRHWYRYHHLFADVLAAHLRAEQPDHVAALHRRASAWYAQHGEVANAIRHALAAQDFGRAADLVELAVPALRRNRQEASVLGWLRALPDALVQARPVLSAAYAWALLATGELAGVETRLQDAERGLDPAAPEPVIVDADGFRRIPRAIAVHRAALALAQGDVGGTVSHARRALDLMLDDDHLWRGAAAALLGLASWAHGDLAAAHRAYAESMAWLQRAGHSSDVIGCALALADIEIAQGRLRAAMQTYTQAVQPTTEQGAPAPRGTPDMYVGISELHREQNDLHAAAQYLQRSQELGEHMGLPQNPYRWRVAAARIKEAQGDPDGALDLLHDAERRYVGDFSPNVRPVAALKARVWVRQGRLGEALGWAQAQGLSADDELSYLHEFAHITLARALLACAASERTGGAMREAGGLLQRLLQAAEAGGRTGSVIEILALQALAQQLRGDTPAALAPLARAMALAEPEGYVRLFVDEGPPMAALLEGLRDAGRGMQAYTHTLLAAFGNQAAAHPSPLIPQPSLAEPLSDRERDVLRLLGSDLDGPEIAHELVISLNTLRTHTKNIYSKLGVSNRVSALRRARELGLL